jgi:hypothetical protein
MFLRLLHYSVIAKYLLCRLSLSEGIDGRAVSNPQYYQDVFKGGPYQETDTSPHVISVRLRQGITLGTKIRTWFPDF